MTLQATTYVVVGFTFAIYIGIAIWSRASTTKDFYVAGTGPGSPVASFDTPDLMAGSGYLAVAAGERELEYPLAPPGWTVAARDGILDNLPWNLGERVTTGSPLAILDGTSLTALRTGAASGAASGSATATGSASAPTR